MFQNMGIHSYKFTVSKRPPSLLVDAGVENKWREILFSVCLFKAQINGQVSYFCIDCRDSFGTDSYGMGYHLPLLDKVKYYFKVNYNQDAINSDPILKQYRHKIISVPLFFPVKVLYSHLFLPRIIPCDSVGWRMTSVLRRVKMLRNLLSLNDIVSLRQAEKNIDLFFVVRYYGQGHDAENDFRYEIMQELTKHNELNSIFGFSGSKNIPAKYKRFLVNGYGLGSYLRNLAKARVGIYVRGLHGCLSFKFGQLLAMGKPIVGQTIINNKKQFYDNPHFYEQFAFDDPKLIVQKAIDLLSKPNKIRELEESNAEIFDTKYTPEIVVSDILRYLKI